MTVSGRPSSGDEAEKVATSGFSGARPSGSLSSEAMRNVFGSGGTLADVLDAYEAREEQAELAEAVTKALTEGRHLLAEAGTGTGKSLAYLVPALARAVGRGERVVVATHTHTLQEQLVMKDIPSLRQWLPWDFDACLL